MTRPSGSRKPCLNASQSLSAAQAASARSATAIGREHRHQSEPGARPPTRTATSAGGAGRHDRWRRRSGSGARSGRRRGRRRRGRQRQPARWPEDGSCDGACLVRREARRHDRAGCAPSSRRPAAAFDRPVVKRGRGRSGRTRRLPGARSNTRRARRGWRGARRARGMSAMVQYWNPGRRGLRRQRDRARGGRAAAKRT